MKNKKERIELPNVPHEDPVDTAGVGLVLFVTIALWMLLFQSNVFN